MATPEQDQVKVKQWIDDWNEIFSIDYTEDEIQSLIGSKVEVTRSDGGDTMTFDVVGYSKSLVAQGDDEAVQFSILTQSGLMLQLRTGISLKVVE